MLFLLPGGGEEAAGGPVSTANIGVRTAMGAVAGGAANFGLRDRDAALGVADAAPRFCCDPTATAPRNVSFNRWLLPITEFLERPSAAPIIDADRSSAIMRAMSRSSSSVQALMWNPHLDAAT